MLHRPAIVNQGLGEKTPRVRRLRRILVTGHFGKRPCDIPQGLEYILLPFLNICRI
jgi:hypothetical protein